MVYRAIDPRTGSPIEPDYSDATVEEIDSSVKLAETAFVEYRKTSSVKRAAFLDQIGEEILRLGDELIDRCSRETGLPEGRLAGERGRTVGQLRLFAELLREGSWVEARIDPAIPDRAPLPRPDLRRMLVPLGPVGIFGASNFPLAFSVAGGDTASALAAGCSVVFKAHPAHPGTSDLVAGAILKAAQATGMPDGVFSLIHGSSHAVGMALVSHPLIHAVGFTGSFRGGKALFDAAARRDNPIPVFAEMGSVNPVFILPGTLAQRGDAIAAGLAGSVTLGVGQFCTNPGLVVVEQSDNTDRFIVKLGDMLSSTGPGVMLTESIATAYESGISSLAASDGVEVIAQGSVGEGVCLGSNRLLRTSAATFVDNPDLASEVFGPSTLVVVAAGRDELLRVAAELEGQLTATVHGSDAELRDSANLMHILERKVGRLIVNGYPTGVEVGHAMHHGGPYPATTAPWSTSVGTAAIGRFARPICYQDFPPELLPDELKAGNPLGIVRMIDGKIER